MSLPFNKRVTVWVQEFKDRKHLVLQWIDPDTGKRKSQSAETSYRPEADLKAKELEYEINHGIYQNAANMSWEKFRQLFEDEYVSGLRAKTRKHYLNTFVALERECNLNGVSGITERTLSSFVGALRRRPGQGKSSLMESTIKGMLQDIRTALRWAVQQKIIPHCPTFPKTRAVQTIPQPVPCESFERLLKKAQDENMRAFLLCGWLAGLRLNEACLLEREESDQSPYVDWKNDRIVFPANFVKGRTDQWVPLDRELRTALERLPGTEKRFFRFVDRRRGDGQAIDVACAETVSVRVSRLAREAGVKLTMKSLRRGFACYWASRVPAQVLQKLMRHSNIAITMKYYANVDDAAMKAILERSPSVLEVNSEQNMAPKRNNLRNRRESEDGGEHETIAPNSCPAKNNG